MREVHAEQWCPEKGEFVSQSAASSPYPGVRVVFRPLHPIVRAILILSGTLALALGVVGIVLPGLPTTPFLLLAAGCYLRSSERLFIWLTEHPRLGPTVRRYVRDKAVPLQVKLISLAIAWTALGGAAVFVAKETWVRALLVAIAVAKTAFMFRVRTLEDRQDPSP